MNGNLWQWRNGILTCELLSRWQHGFFTRSHATQMPADLQKHFPLASDAYRAKQVHGKRLVRTTEITAEAPLPEADGVWAIRSHDARQSVWVCTADCVPILIGDVTTDTVAAVHAGWRGTAAGIVREAIATLIEAGSQLENLRVALGPAISGEVYQVSQTVADQVVATITIPVGALPDPEPDRCRLDLRQVQVQQLVELGIDPTQVAIAPYCTLTDRDRFFSYRRYCLETPDPQPRSPQVQWSGIALV